MNMLSGATGLGGMGGSSSSVSSSSFSLWSDWYASSSLLFTVIQTEVQEERHQDTLSAATTHRVMSHPYEKYITKRAIASVAVRRQRHPHTVVIQSDTDTMSHFRMLSK